MSPRDIHHLALPQDTRSTVEVQQKVTHVVPGTFQIRTRLSQLTQFVSLFSSTQWNLGRVPAEGSRPFSNQSCRWHGNVLHRKEALTVSSNTRFQICMLGMLVLLLVTCDCCFTSFDGCHDVFFVGCRSHFPGQRDPLQ